MQQSPIREKRYKGQGHDSSKGKEKFQKERQEKAKVNSTEMKLSAKSTERYETAFQVYREAAAGANGGKSGGGCGCN